jgi:TonB family protein
MTSEILRALLEAALAGTAAVALLLCLRRPLRARFGARVAYQAWLLVPLSILAVWLPAPGLQAGAADAASEGGIRIAAALWSAQALTQAPVATTRLLVSAWAAGIVLSVCWYALRQRRFLQLLQRKAGSAFDTVSGHGPAVVGWWRARIVLPEDFRERYTRGEQRLVLAHEIAHLRRGDIHAQATATALRCLFWFNPLIHYAAGLFRFDQELACDATVLERFPRGRGRYGSAMLKTQLAGFGLPVGCHWQSSHPLKERIEMLKRPLPARARKLSGSLAIATLMVAASYAAWAAQPAAPAVSQAQVPWLTHVDVVDRMDPPVYPADLEAKGITGSVVIELLVGVDGNVKEAKVVKSKPAVVFDQAAIDAALKWHIASALEGKAVERRVRTQIDFEIHDKQAKQD